MLTTLRGRHEGVLVPNGKIGDHPFTDILSHGRAVYSPSVDALVREVANLSDEKGRAELADMLLREYNELLHPDVATLERILTTLRDRLVASAKSRGYEL